MIEPYTASYYQKNAERLKAKARERMAKRRSENPELVREQQRVWCAANKDRVRELDKAFKRANPFYAAWQTMIARCERRSSNGYAAYGARGITVCPRWRKSYAHFVLDMGNKPTGTSLGRKDNDGPYSPENCRWETPLQQANNKRNNVWLSHSGVSKTVAQWARHMGIKPYVLTNRLRRGWSVEEAIETPV